MRDLKIAIVLSLVLSLASACNTQNKKSNIQDKTNQVAQANHTKISAYPDGRPAASLRMDAKDLGIVLKYGDGPGECDILGACDVWVFEDNGSYYMHYDAAGPSGWISSLAISKDLINWEKKGPILDLGEPGEDDSKSAAYGVTYLDGEQWHMFYLVDTELGSVVPLGRKRDANGSYYVLAVHIFRYGIESGILCDVTAWKC